jgi:phospholipase D1/2
MPPPRQEPSLRSEVPNIGPLAASELPAAPDAAEAPEPAAHPSPTPANSDVTALITAGEAYPALERAFLAAETEIYAGFRVFDLNTRLHSPEARTIGERWYDLMIHTLRRGVKVTVILSDFDPVARPQLHRATWRSVRMFVAAAELSGAGKRLKIVPAMHSAVVGIGPRMLFWPLVLSRLIRVTGWLRRQLKPHRLHALREMPGVRRLLSDPERPSMRLLHLPPLYPATHHQKLCVIDGKRLYIGGLDLDERFYDTPEHRRPAEETWHDVQLMIEGEVAQDALAHLHSYLDAVSGRAAPVPAAPEREGLRFLRTLSRRRHWGWSPIGISPEPLVGEIEAAHRAMIAEAKGLIYVETQYFRDRALARAFAQRAAQEPSLRMILILPAAPDDVAFEGNTALDARLGEFLQSRALAILRKGFGDRLFVGGAAQPRPARGLGGRARLKGAPLVYIHAKVSLFDDRSGIVSSANLNGRSLRWDTEAGVAIQRPEVIHDLRLRLMAHWLPKSASAPLFAPDTAVAAWRSLAARNAARPPAEREGFLLPYDFRPGEDFGRAFPLVPDELV